MDIVMGIEKGLWLLITLCYFYQVFYICFMLVRGSKNEPTPDNGKRYRYGIVISARNEEKVICHLIDSIQSQTYPEELITVYVVADNCTDRTAELARSKGAVVYERFNQQQVGKGYALDYLFGEIYKTDHGCDAFIILDADNILEPTYVEEMNKTFQQGYRIITSYRNSKNYDTNWITAGYSLWFLRESKFLNNARMKLHTSCAVSGTGFLVREDVIRENKGWKFFLLTEDIEFSVSSIIKGERIGYCEGAVLYDEQPVTFRQSWDQRLRWAKGFYQVLGKYGIALAKNIVAKRSFACFDMLMTIFPAIFVTLMSILCCAFKLVYAMFVEPSVALLLSTLSPIVACYLSLYALGLITTITEWNKMNCPNDRKIRFTFTFPIFMLSYIPIAVVALFKKVRWVPIQHNVVQTVEQVQNGKF